MLDPKQLKQRILNEWPDATVDFIDTTGTGDHFQALVVSPAFEGKTMIEQHRMVNAIFNTELRSGELHALGLKTFSPSQWEKKQQNNK